ncbi:hypothetical protein [Chondrinema litorale]|uniref:hypothetical protein n=1 Tax=Chondrinema litorale TaxID=2994555 RepID=UPI002542D969|nr:hypothetical protein [Chondrinema litorale]UZR99535.1 hypothetical protein OQ292_36700 [Chondrinema litorale]
MKHFTILVLSFLYINAFAQNKEIKGDTAFVYEYYKEFAEELQLTNFSTSQNDFSFRLWNLGHVVELVVHNDSVSAQLVNYIYRFNRKDTKRDTISSKIQLDSAKALSFYQIITHSGILDLPSDNQIEGWAQGLDGITYNIEYANSKTQWFKNYWTPTAQKSLPEALFVINFLEQVFDSLDLETYNAAFKEQLPHRGCYTFGEGLIHCYAMSVISIGYYGSTKLPFGYEVSKYFGKIGKLRTNIGIMFSHQFDRFNNCDISIYTLKNLLIKKHKYFLAYNYRIRKLNFIENENTLTNHKVYSGLQVNNNLNFLIGFDYLIANQDQWGLSFIANQSISKIDIDLFGKASLFQDRLDYQIGANKYLSIKNISTTFGLEYEQFMDFRNLKFSLSVGI